MSVKHCEHCPAWRTPLSVVAWWAAGLGVMIAGLVLASGCAGLWVSLGRGATVGVGVFLLMLSIRGIVSDITTEPGCRCRPCYECHPYGR